MALSRAKHLRFAWLVAPTVHAARQLHSLAVFETTIRLLRIANDRPYNKDGCDCRQPNPQWRANAEMNGRR